MIRYRSGGSIRRLLSFSLICIAATFTACKTYYIPVSTFREQFAGKQKSRVVKTQSPFGDVVSYRTYPMPYIQCVDKSGKPAKLAAGPSIELRFTDTNNRRTIFYYDLMTVDSQQVYGSQSRIIYGGLQKAIPFTAIKKIEVQDGKKSYRYIK